MILPVCEAMLASRTLTDLNAGDPPHEIRHRFDHRRQRRRLAQKLTAACQLRRLVSTRQQAVVTNAPETGRQHM